MAAPEVSACDGFVVCLLARPGLLPVPEPVPAAG